MTGLGCRMDDMSRAQGGEAIKDGAAVPDVEFVVLKLRVLSLEALLIPTGVPLRPEEVGAHVVVHSMDLPAEFTKIGHNFRANESRGSGNKEFHEWLDRDGALPNRRFRQHIAALVDEWPSLRDMHMGRVLPVGVVDEEKAAGLELGQGGAGADGAVPAIDDDEVERRIRNTDNGRGIGRQWIVIKCVGLGVWVFERDVAEIDVGEASLLDLVRYALKPGMIGLDASERRNAAPEPEGAAATTPLEPSHVRLEICPKPPNGSRGEPGVVGVELLIDPVFETTGDVEGAE